MTTLKSHINIKICSQIHLKLYLTNCLTSTAWYISEFPTSRLEMSAVADIFDRDGDGYIDYYEFVAALHPNKDAYKPITDADKIEDEVLVGPLLQQGVPVSCRASGF